MTVGEMIKELRIHKGLTQKQLGELCGGMADSAIRRYESGRANPKLGTLKKIADALEVTIDILLGDNWSLYFPEFLKENSDNKENIYTQKVRNAYFSDDEYTELELDEIKLFAEFIKSRRNQLSHRKEDTPD